MEIVLDEDIGKIISMKFNLTKKPSMTESFLKNGTLTTIQAKHLLSEIEKIYDVRFTSMDGLESPAKIAEWVNNVNGLNNYTVRKMFLEICGNHAGEKAVVFDGEALTYDLLKSSVEKIAINMLNKGVLKGEKVALILSNRIEYILSYFALFYSGALPVPLNTRWEKQEVFNVLQDSESRFIICEEKVGNIVFGKYIIEYIATFDSIEKVFYFGSNLYGSIGIPFKSLTDESSQDGVALETLDPDSPAMISYTSGTTGIPKGVVLKHNDIVKISKYTGAIWADEDDLPFSIAPLYSAQGFLSLFINFATEKCFTMIASFNPNDILKEISKEENTVIHTQPTMWTLLLNCRIIEFVKFNSMRKLVVSGSLCAPELAKRIEKKIKCVLLNAYGLIEATSVVTITRLDDPEDVRYKTVGRPIPGVEIRIVDAERKPIPHGETGELVVRGYNMVGYYNNPEKTAEVIDEEGWLYTGDLARYYDEENISIVGRCKDMIIRGGFNVYPSDIEEYILQIPKVQTVAVIGNIHEVLGIGGATLAGFNIK